MRYGAPLKNIDTASKTTEECTLPANCSIKLDPYDGCDEISKIISAKFIDNVSCSQAIQRRGLFAVINLSIEQVKHVTYSKDGLRVKWGQSFVYLNRRCTVKLHGTNRDNRQTHKRDCCL